MPDLDLPLAHRLPLAAAVFTGALGAYYFSGIAPHVVHPAFATPLDRAVPFVPEAVWVYMPCYYGSFVTTLLVTRDRFAFRAAGTAFLTITLLALPFFLLFPVAAPRPAAPGGPDWTAAFVRWLYENDPLVNTFPSLHVANAFLCAFLAMQSSRRWGFLLGLNAVAVCASVLLLKQHWAVDVPGGMLLASLGAFAWKAHMVTVEARGHVEPPWQLAPLRLPVPFDLSKLPRLRFPGDDR